MIYLMMVLKKFFFRIFILLLLIFPINIISQIIINEISAHKGYLDEYGENTDWIEITNSLNNSFNLDDFILVMKLVILTNGNFQII